MIYLNSPLKIHGILHQRQQFQYSNLETLAHRLSKTSGHRLHCFIGHFLASQPEEILAIDYMLLNSLGTYKNALVTTNLFSKSNKPPLWI